MFVGVMRWDGVPLFPLWKKILSTNLIFFKKNTVSNGIKNIFEKHLCVYFTIWDISYYKWS